MMRSTLWIRSLVLGVLTLAALFYVAPSFFEPPSWLRSYFPAERIHLGLDLQGGTHLLLEVQINRAVENVLAKLENRFTHRLEDEGVTVEQAPDGDGNSFGIAVEREDRAKVAKLVRSEFPQLNLVRSETAGGNGDMRFVLNKKSIRSLSDDTVDQALEVIRNRVDQFGVSEPVIQRQGSQDILVQLPGVHDPQRAKALIGKTARLEFMLLDKDQDVEKALKDGPPPGTKIFYGVDKAGGKNGERTPYLVDTKVLMTGATIQDARVRVARRRLSGLYVQVSFNSAGAALFEKVTAENVKRRLAIVMDDHVYSAPVIQEAIRGGRATITGNFTLKEAHDLAIVLRAGALPVPVKIIEERTVGPSLGRDSVRDGLVSFILGGLLVTLFMAVYYRGGGLLADLALVFNLLFLMGILVGFRAVLTLPGIAGIVLTVGMAVDANVLINERIREELRAGRAARAAVEAGYRSSFPAIVDSNLTTFLAGVILFQFGTGPIRGFALTLCVGILTSVGTAVFLTRLYYDYRLSRGTFRYVSV